MENIKAIKSALIPFTKKNISTSFFQLINTLIPLLTLYIVCFYIYQDHYWGVLLLAPLMAGLQVRVFIFLHDCGHGSFFTKPSWNNVLGNLLGFFFLTPFAAWKYLHNTHHAHHGNLDKRTANPDTPVLTVDEFQHESEPKKRIYAFVRSSWTWLFLVGNLIFLFSFRIPKDIFGKEGQRAVLIYNVLYVFTLILISYLIPLSSFLMVYFPSFIIAYSVGAWLFYVQHQFEDAYWENQEQWTFEESALLGSSCLKLPKIVQWFTGNIGFHHIHHLNPAIPNYNLETASATLDQMNVPKRTIHLKDVAKTWRYKLWDERKKKMVPF